MTGISDEDREVITSQGLAARRLLSSPDYVTVINLLADEATLAMSSTDLGKAGRAEREQHHALLVALHAVHAKTMSLEAALSHLESLDATPEDEPEEDDE